MAEVKAGDRIAVHYKLYRQDGSLAACSEDAPVIVEAGSEELLPGLRLGLLGMRVGEKRWVDLPPDRGFGERQAAVERLVPADKMPAGVEVGDLLRIELGGVATSLWVLERLAEAWRVSTVHPLAGEALRVEVEVVELAI